MAVRGASDRGEFGAGDPSRPLAVTRGRPIAVLDGLGNLFSLPDKVLLLSAEVGNHVLGDELEALVRDFSSEHALRGLKVRLNEYAPLDELGRLFRNHRVHWLWRSSLGLLFWVSYVLNVGRLLGRDHYNPFTHSVNLYSGHPGIVLHEMGHAFDFEQRRLPGAYALLRFVPGVALYQEYLASAYAVAFCRRRGDAWGEIRSYRILFPAYSTYVFGAVADLVPSPVGVTLAIPFVILGHLLGRSHAAERFLALGGRASLGFSLEDVNRRDREAFRALFSPDDPRGRALIGCVVGLVAGLVAWGPFFFLGPIVCCALVEAVWGRPRTG